MSAKSGAALSADARPEPPAPGLEPGPYEAERYRVSVEADYVVVDVPR